MMSRGCSRLTAVMSAVFFILAAMSSLIVFHIEYNLLRPDLYVEAIEEGGFAERFSLIAAKELAAELAEDPCIPFSDLCDRAGDLPAYFAYLSPSDWQQILELIITPEWMSDQVGVLIHSFFALLDADQPISELSVDLRPIKSNLDGQNGSEIIEIFLASLPTCTADQITELTQLFLNGGEIVKSLVCSPPPELNPLAQPILKRQLDIFMQELPDQIPVRVDRILSRGESSPFRDFEMLHRRLQRALVASALIAAISMLGMLMFAVRSWRDLLAWTGSSILITGLLLLILGFTFRSSMGILLQSTLDISEASAIHSGTVELIGDMIGAVLRTALRSMLYISGGIAFTGAILLSMSRLFPSQSHPVKVSRRPENLY